MTRSTNSPEPPSPPSPDNRRSDPPAHDLELLHVQVHRHGTNVDVRWSIHPQLKHELLPNEWTEVSQLMTKVTEIVGHRFSQILSQAEPSTPQQA
ncbi:MAG: hypothetical protein NNA18_09480 [Nitrospira sp.]|nr:hypothetical protein [Nitrospira sp.]